jgi:hypothetical protein
VDVKITGVGPPPEVGRPTVSAAPRSHSHAEAVRDTVSTSIPLAASDSVQRLLQTVEDRLFPGGAHRAESMHTAALSAALVDARGSAEKSVTRAAQLVDSAPAGVTRVHGQVDPRIVLMVANDLITSNQLSNYLRAGELGREVIAWYEGPLAVAIGEIERAEAQRRYSRHEKLLQVWNRAPLLVLLVTWLLSGIIVDLLLKLAHASDDKTIAIVEFWAIGFLALIVFQFIATVRGAFLRRRR